MVYRGTYKNGIVVLDEKADLPEGQRVRVDLEQPAIDASSGKSRANGDQGSDKPTIWQALRELSGCLNSGNSDASRNHDHYIYGIPKWKPE